jgi:hypothetical protein
MEGVLEIKRTGISTKLRQAKKIVKSLKEFSPEEQELLNCALGPTEKTVYRRKGRWGTQRKREKVKKTETTITKLEEVVEKLKRCSELEKKFNLVQRDETCKKQIKHPDSYLRKQGKTLEIPLIFHTKIPCKASTSMRRGSYNIKTKTPTPTTEALKVIKETQGLFEHYEVWWVPNNLLIEKLPPKNLDPIVVGVINIPRVGNYCFELHRWVDDKVETPWWSQEGY